MAQNTEITDLLEKIEADYGVEVEITGGGKGWTATDGETTVKATSKIAALQALDLALTDADEMNDESEAGEEIEGCSDECQSSTSNVCQCKCDGENHGIAGGLTKGVVVVGDKPCKCGCGQSTKRTFVPGHDARYHGLIALREWGTAQGFTANTMPTDDLLRKLKAAANRKAARERRAAKRAGEAEIAAKMVDSIKASARPTKRQVAANAKVAKSVAAAINGTGDDLPF